MSWDWIAALIAAVIVGLALYAQGYRDGRTDTRLMLSKPARRIVERERQ